MSALRGRNEQLAVDVAAAGELSRRLISHRESLEQLVAEYRRLPILRLRDRVIRLPLLGGVARRTARTVASWLARRQPS